MPRSSLYSATTNRTLIDRASLSHGSRNYPAGSFADLEGWHLMSDFYEHEFDDTEGQRRRRFEDEVVRVDGRLSYNLRCTKCDRRGKGAGAITVPLRWETLQVICNGLLKVGESSADLMTFAAIVKGSAGRKQQT